MIWADIFPTLVAVATSGVMVTTVQVLAKRKETDATAAKSKADAAEVNSRTAILWSEQQARQIAQMQRTLEAYQSWAKSVVGLVREAGLEVDDPPQMWFS